MYYSSAYPEPEGFAKAPIEPASAFYSTDLREFILPYDEVRNAKLPEDTLLDFLQTSYEAAADLAKWDRAILEGLRYPCGPTFSIVNKSLDPYGLSPRAYQ